MHGSLVGPKDIVSYFVDTVCALHSPTCPLQDANGSIGLKSGNVIEKTPVELMSSHVVVKIASGTDHLVCLTQKGEIFTQGTFVSR